MSLAPVIGFESNRKKANRDVAPAAVRDARRLDQ
jgi:hypothetical protein